MLKTLAKGLLPFFTTVAAIILYLHPSWIWWLAVPGAIAAISGAISWRIAPSRPRIAAIVVNGWYFASPLLLIGASLVVFLVTINAKELFDPAIEAKPLDTFSGAIIGAATTFLATLWTDDIAKHQGPFWPGNFLKMAWTRKFDGDPGLEQPEGPNGPEPRPPLAEAAFKALYDDEENWGPLSRFQRAQALWAWLKP